MTGVGKNGGHSVSKSKSAQKTKAKVITFASQSMLFIMQYYIFSSKWEGEGGAK